MTLLRTFVALEFSEKARKSISQYIEALRRYDFGIRWTTPENIHLTVKFIGDTPEAQVSQIAQILKEICSEISPFEASLEEVGTFPNDRNPRILWIGLNDREGRIEDFAKAVNRDLLKLGISPDTRRFRAHVTIGRVKKGKAARTIAFMRQNPFSPVKVTLEDCTLMKSELTPKGAEYSALERIAFGQ